MRPTLLLLAALLAAATQPISAVLAQQTTFRATTEGVRTTLRVLNARGAFVPDLRQDEIRIYEDDVEQTITFFAPWIGGRNLRPAEPTTAAAPAGLVMPPVRASTDLSGRIFIIFIDDLHLQPLDTPRVKHVLGLIRDELLHEGDLVGITSSGYSAIAVDLTYDHDHARFNEAIERVMGSAPAPGEVIAMPETSQGPQGLRFPAQVALGHAYDLLGRAAEITDRRKAVIYVSSGYDFNPFEDSRYRRAQQQYGPSFQNPFQQASQQFADTDLVAALAELVREAQRANVVFFTMDPRGQLDGPDIDTDLTPREWSEHARTTLGSLRVMADETGGFCTCNSNDFVGSLRRIDNELSDYYVIGYTSTNPDPLHVRRRVRIEITREGEFELTYGKVYAIER